MLRRYQKNRFCHVLSEVHMQESTERSDKIVSVMFPTKSYRQEILPWQWSSFSSQSVCTMTTQIFYKCVYKRRTETIWMHLFSKTEDFSTLFSFDATFNIWLWHWKRALSGKFVNCAGKISHGEELFYIEFFSNSSKKKKESFKIIHSLLKFGDLSPGMATS